MHWINERVISDAKMMLRNKEISIDDIRLKLGFKTLPHFTNFFKQNVGINPQNYRNNVEDLPY
jgi:AraC-like DNA-binding protein